MTNINLVKNRLLECSGKLLSDVDNYQSTIEAAIQTVNSKLLNEEHCNDLRVVNLCAMTALYEIAMILELSNESVQSLKIGDVSLSKGTSTVDIVKGLLDSAATSCMGIVAFSDTNFDFKVI